MVPCPSPLLLGGLHPPSLGHHLSQPLLELGVLLGQLRVLLGQLRVLLGQPRVLLGQLRDRTSSLLRKGLLVKVLEASLFLMDGTGLEEFSPELIEGDNDLSLSLDAGIALGGGRAAVACREVGMTYQKRQRGERDSEGDIPIRSERKRPIWPAGSSLASSSYRVSASCN